jgi:hypothetical protein
MSFDCFFEELIMHSKHIIATTFFCGVIGLFIGLRHRLVNEGVREVEDDKSEHTQFEDDVESEQTQFEDEVESDQTEIEDEIQMADIISSMDKDDRMDLLLTKRNELMQLQQEIYAIEELLTDLKTQLT